MNLTIWVEGENGGTTMLGSYLFTEPEAERLQEEFTNHFNNSTPNAGAYKAQSPNGAETVLMLRFDKIVAIG